MSKKLFWKKRAQSFVYAFRGISYALRTQHNLWIQLSFLLLAVILGWAFNIERLEWLAIIEVSGLVLALEILNTALETFLDTHYPERDPKIGLVKDIAAGAVLIAAIAALIVGLLIFIPKLLAL